MRQTVTLILLAVNLLMLAVNGFTLRESQRTLNQLRAAIPVCQPETSL